MVLQVIQVHKALKWLACGKLTCIQKEGNKAQCNSVMLNSGFFVLTGKCLKKFCHISVLNQYASNVCCWFGDKNAMNYCCVLSNFPNTVSDVVLSKIQGNGHQPVYQSPRHKHSLDQNDKQTNVPLESTKQVELYVITQERLSLNR